MKKLVISGAFLLAVFALSAADASAQTMSKSKTTQNAGMDKGVMVGGAMMVPSKNIVENALGSSDHTTLVAAVKAAGLAEILTQKYLAFFQNSGLMAFYNQRRTGVPKFETGPGTGNSSRIPLRWQYPVTERSYNTSNNKAAVMSQFGEAGDNINAPLWILW